MIFPEKIEHEEIIKTILNDNNKNTDITKKH